MFGVCMRYGLEGLQLVFFSGEVLLLVMCDLKVLRLLFPNFVFQSAVQGCGLGARKPGYDV